MTLTKIYWASIVFNGVALVMLLWAPRWLKVVGLAALTLLGG